MILIVEAITLNKDQTFFFFSKFFFWEMLISGPNLSKNV